MKGAMLFPIAQVMNLEILQLADCLNHSICQTATQFFFILFIMSLVDFPSVLSSYSGTLCPEVEFALPF